MIPAELGNGAGGDVGAAGAVAFGIVFVVVRAVGKEAVGGPGLVLLAAAWPRASPCAELQAKVRGKSGQTFALHVRFHGERKQLPIVTLKKSA